MGSLGFPEMIRPARRRELGLEAVAMKGAGMPGIRGGSVVSSVYLGRSMLYQILKRRSARQTLWRTRFGLQTMSRTFLPSFSKLRIARQISLVAAVGAL